MEHVICKHMLNHLALNKILTALQHGLHNGFLCETQLLVMLHDRIQYKHSKLVTYIVILYISKAFDTTPHDKLLYKLRHYGITCVTFGLDI